MCLHLEVGGFSTHVVDFGGRTQVMTLQKCINCNEFLTLDGSIVSANRIISSEASSKAKTRTVTVQMNSNLYEELERLTLSETGGMDSSKIVNEIISIGLKNYDRKHL